MQTAETRIRVRYAETDQMGVVYHANYIIWMEVGRVEFFRANGLRYRDMERDDGVLLAVAEVQCRFRAPALYDEEVSVLVDGLVSLLEPLMVVILGFIVGFIVIALFMPLVKLLNDLS